MERPSYPEQNTCNCRGTGEPEWEWQFGDVWCCLGCGLEINSREEEPDKPARKFKKGDLVAIATTGAGVVSYEPHTVACIRKGRVILKGNEYFVFDAVTGERVNCGPGICGFSFRLVAKSQVPPSEWERRCREFGLDP